MTASIFDRCKQGGFHPCEWSDYDYALCDVPPEEYLKHGFVMGEPYSATRWYCFYKFDDRYWAALLTIDEAKSVLHVNERGVTYIGAINPNMKLGESR